MDRAFTVHRLNRHGMKKAERLAATFDTHLSIVQEIVGERSEDLRSNTMDRCIEHLELASFYAKKTLAQKFENQEEGPSEPQPGITLTANEEGDALGRGKVEFAGPVGTIREILRTVHLSERDAKMLHECISLRMKS